MSLPEELEAHEGSQGYQASSQTRPIHYPRQCTSQRDI
jgi:hypothetical protein